MAFPILTKVLHVDAAGARLFTFAIQSVGMVCAVVSILVSSVPVEGRVVLTAGPPATLSGAASMLWIAPHVSLPMVRIVFTLVLSGVSLSCLRTHALVVGDFVEPVRGYWLAAAPVVVCAPLGALLRTRLSVRSIRGILHLLDRGRVGEHPPPGHDLAAGTGAVRRGQHRGRAPPRRPDAGAPLQPTPEVDAQAPRERGRSGASR